MNKLTLVVVAAATLLGAGAASAQGVQFGIGPGGAGVRVDDGTVDTVVTVIGVGIKIFGAVGMRSLSSSQTGIAAAIGIDVISITKIAIECRKRPAWRAVFVLPRLGVRSPDNRQKSEDSP